MENIPINIYPIGLDERGIATLGFFFKKFCTDRCVLSKKEGVAEVFLINMDSMDGEKQLRRIEIEHPLKPIIIMSLHTIENTAHYFARKPLIAKQLLSILSKIERLDNRMLKPTITIEKLIKTSGPEPSNEPASEMVAQELTQTSGPEPSNEPASEMVAQELTKTSGPEPSNEPASEMVTQELTQTSKQKSNRLLGSFMATAQKISSSEMTHFVGKRENIDLSNKKHLDKIYFDPGRYYLGHIKEALQLAKEKNCSVKLIGLSHTVYLSPNLESVYLEISEGKLHYYGITALYSKGTNEGDRTYFSYHFIDDDEVYQLCNGQEKYTQDLQAFLWKLSLWTARGRLPKGVALDVPVSIKVWPNFTRLTELPHALQIVASWLSGPKTILALANNLPIAQRYIFSFFTATYMIGLLEIATFPVRSDNVKKVKQDKKGLFSRLMQKLTS